MNINDPAGVSALLDRLRSSQAWQEAINQPKSSPALPAAPQSSSTEESQNGNLSSVASIQNKDDQSSSTAEESTGTSQSTVSNSIASLLSQLQPDSSPSLSSNDDSTMNEPLHTDSHQGPQVPGSVSSSRHSEAWSSSNHSNSASSSHSHSTQSHRGNDSRTQTPILQDRSRFTYQQALPIVASLSENEDFVKTLASMKKEQEALEQRLWEERTAITQKYENKVKTAMTKATMTGATGLSKHEATMLSDACKKELRRFDTERALLLWDELVSQQQEQLARLGVPTMFVTNGQADRETQQKVMQILQGLV